MNRNITYIIFPCFNTTVFAVFKFKTFFVSSQPQINTYIYTYIYIYMYVYIHIIDVNM